MGPFSFGRGTLLGHTARMAIFGLHQPDAFLGLHFVRTCFIGHPKAPSWPVVLSTNLHLKVSSLFWKIRAIFRNRKSVTSLYVISVSSWHFLSTEALIFSNCQLSTLPHWHHVGLQSCVNNVKKK